MLIDDAKAIHPRAINVRTPSPRSSVFAVVTTTPRRGLATTRAATVTMTPSRSRFNTDLNRYNDTEPQPLQRRPQPLQRHRPQPFQRLL